MDEEEVRIRPNTGIGRNLAPMSIDEIDEYVTRLQAEITRAQAELTKRRDVRGAAEALFKPRADRA